MNVFIFFLIILMLILITQKEGFVERFGLSGHKKEAEYLLINDELTNTSGMEEVPVKVGPHHLQEIILNANKYIQEKIDDCCYIIETSEIKQFKGPLREVVRVMFMCVRNKGFGNFSSIDGEDDTEIGFDLENYGQSLQPAMTPQLEARISQDVKDAYSDAEPSNQLKI